MAGAVRDAGHFVYLLDTDRDGRAEAIFVGRYLLSPTGTARCTLQGWLLGDHADAAISADIDPGHPGFEVAAVGARHRALRCRHLPPAWRKPLNVIRNPQHLALARLPGSTAPQIVVEEWHRARGAHLPAERHRPGAGGAHVAEQHDPGPERQSRRGHRQRRADRHLGRGLWRQSAPARQRAGSGGSRVLA
ncbi:MAG: hypothetical protein U1E17_03310 [Geminicoccaceae bacterium]